MKPIKNPPPPPIGPNTDSDAIANLQDALIFLFEQGRLQLSDEEPEVLQQERHDQFYSDGTRQAVIAFREQFRLEPGEDVDELMAEIINKELFDHEALYLLEGTLSDSSGQPVSDMLISAIDPQYLDGGAQLGEVITNVEGYFYMFYDPTLYTRLGPGVDHTKDDLELVVFAYDNDGNTIASSDPFPNPEHKVWVDLETEPEQPTGSHKVRGWVRSVDGIPGNGMKVIALDQDLRSEQALNRRPEPTNSDGFFEIAYDLESVAKGEGTPLAADLCFTIQDGQQSVLDLIEIIRLPVDSNQPETLSEPIRVGHRWVIMNARPLEIVELILPAGQIETPYRDSEFEVVDSAVSQVLSGQTVPVSDAGRRALTPADLREDEQYSDFTFLTHETSIERAKLIHLAAAYRLSQAMGYDIPVAPLYGLARILDVVDPPGLAAHSMMALEVTLIHAVADNYIPPLEEDSKILAQAIHNLAVAEALNYRPVASKASLAELIAPVLSDETARSSLVSAYANFSGETPAFWRQIHRDKPEIPVEKVQFALQLGVLTQNNAKISQALLEAGEFSTMRDLAHASDERLSEIVQRAAPELPDEIWGETQEEKRNFYVKSMRGALQVAFPTEAVAQVITRVTGEDTSPVANFLKQATNPAHVADNELFDIRSTNVDNFFVSHGTSVLNGLDVEKQDAVKKEVKRAQRLYPLSTNDNSLEGLLKSRYDSAFSISKVSKERFMMEMKEQLGGEEHAALVHERATAASSATLAMAVHLYQAANDAQPFAAGDGIKTMPTWAQNFGSVEMCDCEHCRSVYSPAAYLVDLLEFLEDKCHPNEKGATPLRVFLERRPDIEHLPLTCENTNTPLPYIDLVNEILESYITLEGRLDPSAAHDTGDSTAAELRALPQNLEQRAYNKLAEEVYPTLLPFDRWLEIARAYIEKLGGSRSALMEHFAATLAQRFKSDEEKEGLAVLEDAAYALAARRAIAGERLDLSSTEYMILTGFTFTGRENTGYDASKELLRLYGVDPDEIYATLESGAAGAAVTILQAKLNTWLSQENQPQLTLNGRFDQMVEQAVKAFQVKQELPESGVVDAETWIPLKTLKPEATAAFVAYVPEFLQRTGLSYAELIELMRCRFINPHQRDWLLLERLGLSVDEIRVLSNPDIAAPTKETQEKLDNANVTLEIVREWINRYQTVGVLYSTEDSCDLETVFLQQLNGEPLSADYFWKIQRFIRLWRKLEWTIQELDLALVSLGFSEGITPETIEALAQVKKIRSQTDESLDKLLTLWSNINTHGDNALYRRLFQNKSVLNPIDEDFELSTTGKDLARADKTLTEKTPALLAAMRLHPAALVLIRKAENLVSADSQVNISTLTQLYRYNVATRLLNISLGDLIVLSRLSGQTPFGSPAYTLAFAETAAFVQGSGFNMTQLTYLFDSETPSPDNLAPKPTWEDEIIRQLGDGLRQIAELHPELTDQNMKELKSQLPEMVQVQLAALIPTEKIAPLLNLIEGRPPLVKLEELEQYKNDLLSCLADFGLNTPESKNKLLPEVNDELKALEQAEIRMVRFEFVYNNLRPHVINLLHSNLIVKTLSDRFGLAMETIQSLLNDKSLLTAIAENEEAAMVDFLLAVNVELPDNPETPPVENPGTDEANLRKAIRRLHKIALFVDTFSLTLEEVRYLREHKDDFDSFDPNDWHISPKDDEEYKDIVYSRFRQWQRVAEYVALRRQLPQSSHSLIKLFAEDDHTKKRELLCKITGWPKEMMDDALQALGLIELKDEKSLERLYYTVRLSRRLGIAAVTLQNWASTGPSREQADAIKQTVKAKYDEATWLNIAQPINDRLRERQRAAMVAYVLTMPAIRKQNITNANQLFEYFLIDVEMSACMLTSRIKQAISSLQLFVQRCLLNLEEYPKNPERSVRPDAINTVQWQWRKNYRVWEANRKVFLYPENWIEPELRDDKSPFFKELESELLQNDVNVEHAERALFTYLEKLDQVARLEVCGMYLEEFTDPGGMEERSILHVFARTQSGDPTSYFYRRLLDNHEWTPWENVPVDIRAQAPDAGARGINLLPVVWKKRLYLFWAEPTEKDKEPKEGPKIEEGKAIDVPPRNISWKVQLGWSIYDQGKWSNKQLSSRSLVLDRSDSFRLCALIENNGELNVSLQTGNGDPASFHWADRNSKLRLGKSKAEDVGIQKRISHDDKGDILQVSHPKANTIPIRILNQTEDSVMYEPLSLLSLSQHYPVAKATSAPLFFQTNKHSYFVQSRERTESFIRRVEEPEQAKPQSTEVTDIPLLKVPQIDLRLDDLGQPEDSLAQMRQYPHPWVSASAQLLPSTVAEVSQQIFTDSSAQKVSPQSSASIESKIAKENPWIVFFPSNTPRYRDVQDTRPTINLKFSTFFHPHVGEFIKGLKTRGVPGLLNLRNQVLGISYLTRPWRESVFTMPISANATRSASVIESGPVTVLGVIPDTFEAVVLEGTRLRHYQRANRGSHLLGWHQGEIITEIASGPGCIAERKSQRKNGTGNARTGDFEVIVLEWNETEGHNELVHYKRNNAPQVRAWSRVGVITKEASDAGCIIVNHKGHLEVSVPVGSNLVHYLLNETSNAWEEQGVVTTQATGPGCLIETATRSLEVVVQEGSKLVHYSRLPNSEHWQRGKVVTEVATGPAWLVENRVHSAPHQGHLEVVVPEGEQLVHYWKESQDDISPWQRGQVITNQLKPVNGKSEGATIFQSSYGRAGNFEVFAITSQGLIHYVHERGDPNFHLTYQPNEGAKPEESRVDGPYPKHQVDFTARGAYSQYNWELFFHVPLILAARLSQNQRFADAQQWFHYIFDPTDSSDEKTVRRYWKMWPLREVERQRIDQLLAQLQAGDDNSAAKVEVVEQIKAWERNPFQPHRIARMRFIAYKKHVVMKYIDNLIAWGDHLFRRDTLETLNEATQLYVLAANLLGPRPQHIPAHVKTRPRTYADLKPLLDEFNNAIVEGEHEIPFATVFNSAGNTTEANSLLGIGSTFYFCIPQNDKMLAYWDLVADRLFKIRHCMNIEGVVRQLPLFEPPIDPALLVKATAAGLDLASVLADLNAPLPHYRFTYMLPKALDLCNEVKALGSSLLAALEKKDGEALAEMRATQEKTILEAMRAMKVLQAEEAEASINVLRASRESAIHRLKHYSHLLGENGLKPPKEPDTKGVTERVEPFQYVPSGRFKLTGGARGSFSISGAGVGAAVGGAVGGTVGGAFGDKEIESADMDSGTKMLTYEQEELVQSFQALTWSLISSGVDALSAVLGILPNFEVATKPTGVGVGFRWGGNQLSNIGSATARIFKAKSDAHSYHATLANRLGSFVWRELEFALQRNTAALEIQHIDKQIVAAMIRKQIALEEVRNHDKQIENAETVETFLQNKFTNQELYTWMVKQVTDVYFQMYRIAYDFAKRTERCFQFELGVNNTNHIRPAGYWDTLRQGLLAGEKLNLALRQLELAYHEQNKREYELTRHVSLLQLNPLALLRLKTLGWCEFDVPEALFDLDFPGHYFRRIRSVSITIPCVAGPYTGVNCTLTLLRNSLRKVSTLSDRYARNTQNDDSRFIDDLTPIQSIATSHAQNDSGLFELNFRDERYLPFEGAGAISRWRIDLSKEFRAFDYNTISDVVMHLKYNAREGGQALGEKVVEEMRNSTNVMMQSGNQTGGLHRLFSLKHEFPSEWHKLLYGKADSRILLLDFQNRFPIIFRGKKLEITGTSVFIKGKESLKDYGNGGTLLGIKQEDDVTSLENFGIWQDKEEMLTMRTEKFKGNPNTEKWNLVIHLSGANEGKSLETLVEILDDIVLVCDYTVK